MDIKLNQKNKSKGIIISLCLLGILAAGCILTYSPIEREAKEWLEEYDHTIARNRQNSIEREVVRASLKTVFAANWKLQQKTEKRMLSPSALYLPEELNEWKNMVERNRELGKGELSNEASAALGMDISQNNAWEVQQDITSLDSAMEGWYLETSNYPSSVCSVQYTIWEEETGTFLSNRRGEKLAYSPSMDVEQIKEAYDFYLVMAFDENGVLKIPYSYNLKDSYREELLDGHIHERLFSDHGWEEISAVITNPKNVQLVLGVPKGEYMNQANESGYYRQRWAFSRAGYEVLALGALFLVFLLAVFLPFVKSLGIKEGILSRIPLEISALGMGLAIAILIDPLRAAAAGASSGILQKQIPWDKAISGILAYGMNFCLWFIVLLLSYIFILTLRQLFTLGFKGFLSQMTVLGRVVRWCVGKGRKFSRSLRETDFTEHTNSAILKCVAINLAILTVLCCFWFFGIFILVIYSIALFFFLKKLADDLKKKYEVLLHETNKMAQGNLNISIDEHLGVFEPLKEELQKVQKGFQKAVEDETKSQQMKTELITNVSHDLKTPLTAIITYVNLLREENITEEERNSYIDTLDRKSIRLKQLIEDLFEVSKANSDNIILNPVEVEIGSLIKQAALELEDKINQCGIDFRYRLPEERTMLLLDSEKTYRIIENLMVNITKYALQGSRAYVQVRADRDKVAIVFKNISATEIDFDGEGITDRFVRGDKSRNSDGSGLGLAIVKSYTEIQGGSFEVVTDGDLFKAVVIFYKPEERMQ